MKNVKTVVLPRTMTGGLRTSLHPLLWCLKTRPGTVTPLTPKSSIAAMLGVRPQTFYKWERLCRENRNFLLPAKRASQLAELFAVHPSMFRPDIRWGE